MRVKPVPAPPADLDGLRDARRAVPLVPGTEDDCCARLMRRLDLPARDEARTWLTFLRGLGLATEGERGFTRERGEIDREDLADALLSGIFGARELASILEAADDPLSPAAVFERFEERVPEWERHRTGTWRSTWEERVERLLGWLALAGLAERVEGGYVRE